jgi:hypothetical protein
MRTIDDVLLKMDEIIAHCIQQNSRAAYFAVLYRQVTQRIKEGILRGEFEDNARMEKLDVRFAHRYFVAYDQYASGGQPTQSWLVAFQAAGESRHIILQHLLLGINAHINLDLGIAAVETAGNQPLDSLKGDFDAINRILSELVDGVKAQLGKASPAFGWLMPLAKKQDEKLVNFSIAIARDGAWRFAQRIHTSPNREAAITERDLRIAALARALAQPGSRLAFLLRLIRLGEWRGVAATTKALEGV